MKFDNKKKIKAGLWDNRFSHVIVNQKVHLFNQTIKNNPHDTVVYDDLDPPWINSEIRGLIPKKNTVKRLNRKLYGRF